jgi:alpha-ketoglutarate-dependent taurine dioxygenase
MTVGYQEAPLSEGMGTVLTRQGQGGVLDLDREAVAEAYRETGAVVLRGFRATAEQFHALCKRFAGRLLVDPEGGRTPHRANKEIQSVTPGTAALNFHAEFGSTPFRPDFIAFWCEVPPVTRGETTLCDGIGLWKSLSEATRRLFTEKRIRHVFTHEQALWMRFFGVTTPAQLQQALERVPRATVRVDPAGTVTGEWVTEAAFRPRFSDELGIATNLFPGVYPELTTTFEDGSPLPAEVIAELDEQARRLCIALEWGAGDVTLVDNTRVLHGRRAIEDAKRRVHACQGFVNF